MEDDIEVEKDGIVCSGIVSEGFQESRLRSSLYLGCEASDIRDV